MGKIQPKHTISGPKWTYFTTFLYNDEQLFPHFYIIYITFGPILPFIHSLRSFIHSVHSFTPFIHSLLLYKSKASEASRLEML